MWVPVWVSRFAQIPLPSGVQVLKMCGGGEHRPRCHTVRPAGRYILSGFLPLVQKLTELIRPAAKGLVVPALAAADKAHQGIAQLHQLLISGGDPGRAVEGAGLALGQIARRQLGAGQQVILLGICLLYTSDAADD